MTTSSNNNRLKIEIGEIDQESLVNIIVLAILEQKGIYTVITQSTASGYPHEVKVSGAQLISYYMTSRLHMREQMVEFIQAIIDKLRKNPAFWTLKEKKGEVFSTILHFANELSIQVFPFEPRDATYNDFLDEHKRGGKRKEDFEKMADWILNYASRSDLAALEDNIDQNLEVVLQQALEERKKKEKKAKIKPFPYQDYTMDKLKKAAGGENYLNDEEFRSFLKNLPEDTKDELLSAVPSGSMPQNIRNALKETAGRKIKLDDTTFNRKFEESFDHDTDARQSGENTKDAVLARIRLLKERSRQIKSQIIAIHDGLQEIHNKHFRSAERLAHAAADLEQAAENVGQSSAPELEKKRDALIKRIKAVMERMEALYHEIHEHNDRLKKIILGEKEKDEYDYGAVEAIFSSMEEHLKEVKNLEKEASELAVDLDDMLKEFDHYALLKSKLKTYHDLYTIYEESIGRLDAAAKNTLQILFEALHDRLRPDKVKDSLSEIDTILAQIEEILKQKKNSRVGLMPPEGASDADFSEGTDEKQNNPTPGDTSEEQDIPRSHAHDDPFLQNVIRLGPPTDRPRKGPAPPKDDTMNDKDRLKVIKTIKQFYQFMKTENETLKNEPLKREDSPSDDRIRDVLTWIFAHYGNAEVLQVALEKPYNEEDAKKVAENVQHVTDLIKKIKAFRKRARSYGKQAEKIKEEVAKFFSDRILYKNDAFLLALDRDLFGNGPLKGAIPTIGHATDKLKKIGRFPLEHVLERARKELDLLHTDTIIKTEYDSFLSTLKKDLAREITLKPSQLGSGNKDELMHKYRKKVTDEHVKQITTHLDATLRALQEKLEQTETNIIEHENGDVNTAKIDNAISEEKDKIGHIIKVVESNIYDWISHDHHNDILRVIGSDSDFYKHEILNGTFRKSISNITK